MSYSDELGTIELSAQVKLICDEMERQGWECVNVIQGRGIRFVCPQLEGCKHSGLWISMEFVSPEFLELAFRRTCLKRFAVE